MGCICNYWRYCCNSWNCLFFVSRAKGRAPVTDVQTSISDDAVQVNVLPQKIRNFKDVAIGEIENPFESDKLENVRLTGVITNSYGRSTAIVETNNTSYIISVGDTMPESSWVVDKISPNSVVFSLGEITKTIYIEK